MLAYIFLLVLTKLEKIQNKSVSENIYINKKNCIHL